VKREFLPKRRRSVYDPTEEHGQSVRQASASTSYLAYRAGRSNHVHPDDIIPSSMTRRIISEGTRRDDEATNYRGAAVQSNAYTDNRGDTPQKYSEQRFSLTYCDEYQHYRNRWRKRIPTRRREILHYSTQAQPKCNPDHIRQHRAYSSITFARTSLGRKLRKTPSHRPSALRFSQISSNIRLFHPQRDGDAISGGTARTSSKSDYIY